MPPSAHPPTHPLTGRPSSCAYVLTSLLTYLLTSLLTYLLTYWQIPTDRTAILMCVLAVPGVVVEGIGWVKEKIFSPNGGGYGRVPDSAIDDELDLGDDDVDEEVRATATATARGRGRARGGLGVGCRRGGEGYGYGYGYGQVRASTPPP